MKNHLQRSAIFLVALFASTSTLSACSIADDVARGVARYGDDVARGVARQGDDVARGVAHQGDDVARGALRASQTVVQAVDNQAPGWGEFAYEAALAAKAQHSASLTGEALMQAVQADVANNVRNQAGGSLSEEQIQLIAGLAAAGVVPRDSADQQ